MKIAVTVLAALTLGLAACGGGGATTTAPATTAPAPAPADTAAGETPTDYTPEVEQTFLTSCEVNSSAEDCQCMFDHIKANVSFDEFAKADAEVAQGGAPPAFVQEAVQACQK